MRTNAPLSEYTYMKVGGPADFLELANTTEHVAELIKTAQSIAQPYFVLGGGSNTIFSDKGFRGLVIINRSNNISIEQSSSHVVVDTGVPTNLLVNKTVAAGLGGLEEFLGIPGSVGGAIYNNSHYLKSLIGDYLETAKIITPKGEFKTVDKAYFNFKYDYSILHETHDVVLSATFKLTPGDTLTLMDVAKTALKRRQSTQPLSLPSSGCIFKNADGVSAGYLIDQAGLKGMKLGGAEVSEKHANFIVNKGGATSADIDNLSNQISEIVKKKTGVTLHREVFFIDEKGEYVSI